MREVLERLLDGKDLSDPEVAVLLDGLTDPDELEVRKAAALAALGGLAAAALSLCGIDATSKVR